MKRNYLSVTQFNTIIRNIFSAEEMLYNITVMGEISGYRISGRHAYFNLKDEGGVLPCSCFFYSKTYKPKEGECVLCIGSPDYYIKGGRFSFVVNKIEAVGIGLLYQKIEALKKKLASEGLFETARKKPIPKFCKNVVVVTSKTGAVIRDIVKTVRKKNPIINIVVRDAKVQGERSANDIVKALKAVDKLGYDCVILARGGGSLEDLMPFYDEKVVRAVANMKTPIISAVGHETDFSLCDFAADARAATPTAAGELVAYDYYQLISDIFTNMNRIEQGINNKINSNMQKTKYLVSCIGNGMEKSYKTNLSRLNVMDMRMKNAVEAGQIKREHKIDKMINSLDKLNPTRILKSGYFRVYSDNLPIMSVKKLKVGDKIMVRGADGKFKADVTDVVEEKL